MTPEAAAPPVATTSSRRPGQERRQKAIAAEQRMRQPTPSLGLPSSEEEGEEEEVRPSERQSRRQSSSEEEEDPELAGIEISDDPEAEAAVTKPKKKARSRPSARTARPSAVDPSASATYSGTQEEQLAGEEPVIPPPEPLPRLEQIGELPRNWYAGIPMTVAIPGRRDEIGKITKVKPKAVAFKAKQLQAAVDSIWTDLRHGAISYWDQDVEEIHRRWEAVHDYLRMLPGLRLQVREFVASAAWKIMVDWQWPLWKCYGPRVANAEERAAFNYMSKFPEELVSYYRMHEVLRKDIGEATAFLDASFDNQLGPRDIWMRLFRELDELDGINGSILDLEGREPTAIVARGMANACAVFKLIDEYALRASGYRGRIRHIELADAGTLSLAITARSVVSWHFGIEDLLVEAIDMESRCRSARQGEHSVPKDQLLLYLGVPPYPVRKDIDLLELSCIDSIKQKLRGSNLTTTLGGYINKWKTQAATRGLRVPLLLSHGSCCSAYRKNENRDNDKLEEFITAFEESVIDNLRDPQADPQPITPYVPCDQTIDLTGPNVVEHIDIFGSTRYGSKLLDLTLFPAVDPEDRAPSLPVISPERALIVVARISLLRGLFEGAPRAPHVTTLLLATGYGHVLAVSCGEPRDGTPPVGTVDYGGTATSVDGMRLLIWEFLGRNNYLVGFHVGWTLTALGMTLPASRVIDLGTEESFQKFCRSLATQSNRFVGYFERDLVNSYDRRIPAMLCGIEYYSSEQDDIVKEGVYTAAIWLLLWAEIASLRARRAVHLVKAMYTIGCGAGLSEDEVFWAEKEVELNVRAGKPTVTSLPTTAEEVLQLLLVAPLDDLPWPGDHSDFLAKCGELLRKCAPLVGAGECAPYRLEFGEHASRCESAVDVALPSRSIRVAASLMVPWINHRTARSLEELRAIKENEPGLRLSAVVCLVTSLLDLALSPELLLAAQQKTRPSVPDPTALPLNVLATSPVAPSVARSTGQVTGAAAKSKSTSSKAGKATETRSTAQRSLVPVEQFDLTASPSPPQPQPSLQTRQPHQPVSLVPVAPFSLPMTTTATARPVRPESASSTSSLPAPSTTRPPAVVALATSLRTSPRRSPAKTPVESAAPTPPRAGVTTRSQSPKIAGKEPAAK